MQKTFALVLIIASLLFLLSACGKNEINLEAAREKIDNKINHYGYEFTVSDKWSYYKNEDLPQRVVDWIAKFINKDNA